VTTTAPPRPKKPPPPRVANIPAELKERDQWVVWKFELRDGKWTKVPYQPLNPKYGAKANEPSTWASFGAAMSCYAHGFDGIGYEFAAGDPYFGADLDHCLEGGVVVEWAEQYLQKLTVSYGEISPSGTGIKFIGRGSTPEGKGTRRNGYGLTKQGALEVYSQTRFFTITGDVFGASTTIVDLPGIGEELYAAAKAKAEPATEQGFCANLAGRL
jgi:putative DNA primase/helicase